MLCASFVGDKSHHTLDSMPPVSPRTNEQPNCEQRYKHSLFEASNKERVARVADSDLCQLCSSVEQQKTTPSSVQRASSSRVEKKLERRDWHSTSNRQMEARTTQPGLRGWCVRSENPLVSIPNEYFDGMAECKTRLAGEPKATK